MDTITIVLVGLLVGWFALGYYMDWFSLWATKAEMQAQIARSKESRNDVSKNITVN